MDILDRIAGPADLKRLDAEQLAQLAEECRRRIVEVITRRGGHLASNLGIVELTLALHRRFDSPKDKLVWDTSNQCYTHKLVTGRRDRFATIRSAGGLSGFAEPLESPHDTLCAGHAGTGLSFALGMALATQQEPGTPYTVAVVGDGALTSGLSYEAINNIVHLRPRRFIAVFNDNGWSISQNVGWLVEWRNRLVFHPRYKELTEKGHRLAARLPHGDRAWEALRHLKNAVEAFFLPNMVWEQLGFHYIGPVDGHDVPEIEGALERAKALSEDGTPVWVHVLSQKGRGFEDAAENPVRFHQPSTPPAAAGGALRPTYSQVFAKSLIRLMERDAKVVAITAAMIEGTALAEVSRRFPERVFDVGIAEAHALTMAAGLARAGWRPVAAIYSTFLQRAFDQILHDVCIQELPVTICVDRAGMVGDDGKTHQGIFDVAFTRIPPGIVVAAPKDENELQHLLHTAVYSGKPFVVRYPRGLGAGAALEAEPRQLPLGRAEVLRSGRDLVLVAYGAMAAPALEAAAILAERGLSCGVLNARFAKPLDVAALRRAAAEAPRLLTLEEHTLTGGFGSAVLEAAAAAALPAAVRCHGIPDRFIEHAPQAHQRRALGLDAPGIVAAALAAFPDLDPAGSRASRVEARGSEPGSRAGEPEAVSWS